MSLIRRNKWCGINDIPEIAIITFTDYRDVGVSSKDLIF